MVKNNSPKRLFQITDTKTFKAVPNLYFSDKQAAKNKRRELNTEHNADLRFIVSPGPDHKKHAHPNN